MELNCKVNIILDKLFAGGGAIVFDCSLQQSKHFIIICPQKSFFLQIFYTQLYNPLFSYKMENLLSSAALPCCGVEPGSWILYTQSVRNPCIACLSARH